MDTGRTGSFSEEKYDCVSRWRARIRLLDGDRVSHLQDTARSKYLEPYNIELSFARFLPVLWKERRHTLFCPVRFSTFSAVREVAAL